jgi:precorrin-6B methylase 1
MKKESVEAAVNAMIAAGGKSALEVLQDNREIRFMVWEGATTVARTVVWRNVVV